MPPSPNVRRHFLPWDRPLLSQVIGWLAGEWRGEGPLDLSRVVAIVPTRQAGRRLREALAGHAAAHGQAVFPPRVLTPDALVAMDLGAAVASRLESLLAWSAVFRSVALDEFRHVFPVDPPVRNFAWSLRLAQEFSRLQATLAETGVTLADMPGRLGEDFVEAARWGEIAELGKRHDAQLAARGLRDPQAARIDAALRPPAERTFDRIVVLAVPDPPPLALLRLAALTQAGAGEAGGSGLCAEPGERILAPARRNEPSIDLEIVVFAPEQEAAAFDDWGRPVSQAWEHRVLAIEHFTQRVHLCADPAAQAARVAALASRYDRAEGILAFGIADPEIAPLLESELTRVERSGFNPEGRPMRDEALYQLLAAVAAFARDPAFANVEALARCPDFFAFLGARSGGRFSIARWLAGLDELRARHLPGDLASAREYAPRLVRFPEVAPGLEAMERVRALLGASSFASGVAEMLREIFGARHLDLSSAADARWEEAAAAWMDVLRECAAAEERFGALAPADGWDLALRLFGDQRRTEQKPAGALELQGWLELLWEDAPHLAVVGVNDGRVPEAVPENTFLPEGLRQRLGLKTSAARLARDAYILQAIAACRTGALLANARSDASEPNLSNTTAAPRHAGATSTRLDLFFGKTSAAGEPLRPSRLLLRCADTELPDRIALLFRAPELADANSAWERAWRIKPRAAPPPHRIPATSLRRYLQCPFRFYLRNVLRVDSVDPLKSELDVFDFGTLCHAALEQIGLDPVLRECTDPAVLRSGLLRHVDAVVRAQYGKSLALPLLIQVESARQRLAKAADLQAAERAAGWVIAEVERPFEVEISGLVVRGKIDRIDRHLETGAVRVLDYKTSDTPVAPAEAHVRRVRPGEPVRDWATFEFAGKRYGWSDLQLPLYLHAVAAENQVRPACGYFNLPKAAGETRLALWDEYTPELHALAMRCAEAACAAIRAGEYWPPNETLSAERDECAALFHHGVEESVEWTGAAMAAALVNEAAVPAPLHPADGTPLLP